MGFYKPQLHTQLNPNTLTLKELIKYRSLDMTRLSTTARNFKRFAPVFITVTFFTYWIAKSTSKNNLRQTITGYDGKGGSILTLRSRNTEGDFDYSREFQRMNYLSEPDMRKESSTNLELEVLRKGGEVGLGMPDADLRKKAPHYKYY